MIEELINSYRQINLDVREIIAAVNKTECAWLACLLGHFIKQGSTINTAWSNSPAICTSRLSSSRGVSWGSGPPPRVAVGNPSRAGCAGHLGPTASSSILAQTALISTTGVLRAGGLPATVSPPHTPHGASSHLGTLPCVTSYQQGPRPSTPA